MKKLSIAFLVVFGLAVNLLLAGDFWDEKKFPEWTPNQVVKILNDSPWALSYAIPVSSPGGGGAPAGDSSGGGGGGKGGGKGGGGKSGGGGGGGGRGAVPEVIIRWYSAMPIRQALVRLHYGAQAATSPEAAKMLARQETVCTIGIANVPSWLVIQAKDQLKAGAQLRIKNHPAIQALEVNADTKTTAVNVFLIFPKEQPGGHVITVDDDEVEVYLKLGTAEIKRKFKLKDMVFNGKLEL